MELTATNVGLSEILQLRNLFLQENNFQIRYNAVHERGWSDSYLLKLNDLRIGYGSAMGGQDRNDRDTIFEFFIVTSFRKLASSAFQTLLNSAKPDRIECQSNDSTLASLLYEFANNINSDTILFKEGGTTELAAKGTIFRRRQESDEPFEHNAEPIGDYVLELNDEIVATGGFLLHYNKPFADLYMEVREDQRRKGFGSYLIQEIKRECYLAGRVPAARTGMDNLASRYTLLKGGLEIAGYMLTGDVKDKR